MADLVYGRYPVLELCKSLPSTVQRLYVLASATKGATDSALNQVLALASVQAIPIDYVSKVQLQELVGPVTHQGIVAQVAEFQYTDWSKLKTLLSAQTWPLVVVLDHLQDPHNLGAIIRSAYVLGADAVILPRDRACQVTAAVTKAAAGATAHLPIVQIVNVQRTLLELQKLGCWCIGTVAAGGTPLTDFACRVPLALVIGGEGEGLRPLVLKTCDVQLQIPLRGNLGSLNASNAAAIFLYEIYRQRYLV